MKRRLLVALLAAASLGLAASAGAADPSPSAPEPMPTSGKPKPGCCCYPHLTKKGEWGCDWGMSEPKCEAASKVLKMPYRWTEGKCPRRGG